MTEQLSKLIAEHAKAERVARHCRDTGRPIPDQVSAQLARGEAIYRSAPPHIRASIDQQLSTAHFRIESDLMQARFQSEERERTLQAQFENKLVKDAAGGAFGSREEVAKAARGEKVVPHTVYKIDKKGNKVPSVEMRAPADPLRRRAQIIEAYDKAEGGEKFADEVNGRGMAELRAKTQQNSKRYHDVANAYEAVQAATFDSELSAPEPAPVERGETTREIASRTWDSLTPSNESTEQAAQ